MRATLGRTQVLGYLTRPVSAAALLLAAYVLLSLPLSGEAYLGTDTGAKVATLHHMVADDTWRPTVGYWAEEWDPDGDFHPLFDTMQTDRGEWVNVTTLPMLFAARPLYDLGGYRLALVLPMAGAVGAALAARQIGRQLGGEDAGWRAFWISGLASPMVVYALDLWEHAIGLGLMLWALSHLLTVVRNPAWHPFRYLLAGVLLGAAATMRTEAFVIAFLSVGGSCAGLLWQRKVAAATGGGLMAVVGFGLPWVLNALLELAVESNSRTTRAVGAVQREAWNEVGERFNEAAITWFGLPGVGFPRNVLVGLVAVVLLNASVLLHRRGERRASVMVLAIPATIFLLFLLSGPAFVPGALIASPMAIAAVWRRRPSGVWIGCLAFAGASTLLTWAFQYTGGASPQWGGRYLLVPTLALTTLGAVAWHDVPVATRRLVLAMSVIVSIFGVAWTIQRSHGINDVFEQLEALPVDVVISTNGFFVREAGPSYVKRPYLSLGRGADLDGAVDVVEAAGFDTFAILTRTADRPELDAESSGGEVISIFDADLYVYEYAFK